MCGIAGIWSEDQVDIDRLLLELSSMTESLHHRGPDDQGQWSDQSVNLGLGHKRLSILDLSPLGRQPMESMSGRYVLVYNGEIYNHKKIRQDLEKENKTIIWKGTSDTETILSAIESWGLEGALNKSNGMFALALWDKEKKNISLARDRIGEKPLYYKQDNSGLSFASEIKALRTNQKDKLKLNNVSASEYLKYCYIPDHSSIYKNINKVGPGTIVTFSSPSATPQIQSFWSLKDVIERTKLKRDGKTDNSLVEESLKLEELLLEVIDDQMISDVPLGSFLSGGIDSSLVTGLMQSISSIPVKTFSIGFKESAYNESHDAREVATQLKTDHQEFLITEEEALEAIKELPKIYDEPFADSSQIPTLLLCRHARKEVTVALTGDGGDEIFGGYNRYLFAPKSWSIVSKFPLRVREKLNILSNFIHFLGGSENNILRTIFAFIGLPGSTLDRIRKLGDTLSASKNFEDIYYGLVKTSNDPQALFNFNIQPVDAMSNPKFIDSLSSQEWMMAMDSLSYLPGDILVKVDRASMSTSLETRAPFLDHRVIEAAWKMSSKYRVNNLKGKIILRHILNRHIPNQMIERPKQGFAIPLDRWLRGELKMWAENILSTSKLLEFGVFNAEAVTELWLSHLSGSKNFGQELWTILMLQCWLEINGNDKLLDV